MEGCSHLSFPEVELVAIHANLGGLLQLFEGLRGILLFFLLFGLF